MNRTLMACVATFLVFGIYFIAKPPKQLHLAQARAGEMMQTRSSETSFDSHLKNPTAYIPPQCYATTHSSSGQSAHNSCFTCHQTPREPNFVGDSEVQLRLSFPRLATVNHWSHLSEPLAPATVTDDELLHWVRQRNDSTLAQTLSTPAAEWDLNHDGRWNGLKPDCEFQFDAHGFDEDAAGKPTGWRAYSSPPTPGMFWPTNGSASDFMIRLPLEYRVDEAGVLRRDLYEINLAIVESLIRRVNVPIAATDERALNSDLNGDGALGVVNEVAFVWPPKSTRQFTYVGKASALNPKQFGWPASGLFPVGTEFLHSLRYFDVSDGQVRMAPRMKELRYMRKTNWLTYSQLELQAAAETREKRQNPDKLKTIFGDAERGLSTGTGWVVQGFIESASGTLRPQTKEETAACVGCHGGVGTTTDSTFSLARKMEGAGGWSHSGAGRLAQFPEPRRADGSGEYAHWLRQVGGGDDYRSNSEVQSRFFLPDGRLNSDMLTALEKDSSVLLVPSAQRALALNRAYLSIVKSQSFELGRDVIVGTAPQIEPRLQSDAATGILSTVAPPWQSASLEQTRHSLIE
jgi:cytochrome c553